MPPGAKNSDAVVSSRKCFSFPNLSLSPSEGPVSLSSGRTLSKEHTGATPRLECCPAGLSVSRWRRSSCMLPACSPPSNPLGADERAQRHQNRGRPSIRHLTQGHRAGGTFLHSSAASSSVRGRSVGVGNHGFGLSMGILHRTPPSGHHHAASSPPCRGKGATAPPALGY